MEFLSQYGMFFLETFTLVAAILVTIAGVMVIASKSKAKGKIEVKKLNKKYQDIAENIQQETLSKDEYKKLHKQLKKEAKSKKAAKEQRKRIFVVKFHGDIKATAVQNLRHEVTAILTVATPKDEVLVILESGGGVVHGYGLGASQLERIKRKNIPLTIAVDKVAASGGYLMACVADKILAAPFAIIGSIGVLAQIPNFHRKLKENNIDFEQITAGEFKRTLTLFGENTSKAREKMQEDVEEIHQIFKDFIIQNRSQVNIEKVATGEHWLARKAFELDLVDALQTSDDFLLQTWKTADLFEIKYKHKKGISEKLSSAMQMVLEKFGVSQQQAQYENQLYS